MERIGARCAGLQPELLATGRAGAGDDRDRAGVAGAHLAPLGTRLGLADVVLAAVRAVLVAVGRLLPLRSEGKRLGLRLADRGGAIDAVLLGPGLDPREVSSVGVRDGAVVDAALVLAAQVGQQLGQLPPSSGGTDAPPSPATSRAVAPFAEGSSCFLVDFHGFLLPLWLM